ncbi:MAG: glycosyltransferase family 4 protein [Steroidobacteraceae bacterium]
MASRSRFARRVYVVSDCPDFKPPYTTGGTERQLSALALELEQCNVDVTVLARAPTDEPAGSSALGGAIRTVYVPPPPRSKGAGWASLAPNLKFILNVSRYLLHARHRYDALIVSGFRQLALPIALLAKLAGKRCIVRIETTWDLDDDLSAESNARIGGVARLVTRTLIRATRRVAFALADRVVAFADPLEERLVEAGAPTAKVVQIPNGVDLERFAPVPPAAQRALREQLRLPLDKSIFIYTGRICRSKGVRDIVRLWERCAERGDLYLLLVGSDSGGHDSCEAEVREFARRHAACVRVTGTVANVAQYLKAADVFLFLSHGEAFGLSVLEAIATGLPCIATDVGCVRQLVRHHESGAIVPLGAETRLLLSELDWMQSQRARWRQMGARGRAQVIGSYALGAVARRYAQLISGVEPLDGRIMDDRDDRPTPIDPFVRRPRRTHHRRAAPRAG